MKNFKLWDHLLKHIVAYLIFLVIAIIFCASILQDKVLQQGDSIQWQGMIKDAQDYADQHNGRLPLWTNNIFGGLPIFALTSPNYISGWAVFRILNFGYLDNILRWTSLMPASFFIMLCFAFYVFTQVIKINYWIAIVGSLLYAYGTSLTIMIVHGHHTKGWIMGCLPYLMAGVFLVFQNRKYFLGAAIFGVALNFMFAYNHVQVVYYIFIMLFFYGIFMAYNLIKQKEFKHLIIGVSVIVIAGLIAFFSQAVSMVSLNEYSKATMRGGSALSKGNGTAKDNKISNTSTKPTSGLDIDYAYNWSYGKIELFSFLVPDVQGGGSSTPPPEDSKFYQELGGTGISPQNAQSVAQQIPMYWGAQPFTAGPIYFGAILVFLFVFAMFYTNSKHKWWVLITVIVAMLLGLGKNFMPLNALVFDYLPFYNKFRTPTQIFLLIQFVAPFIVCIFLQEIFEQTDTNKKKIALKKTAYTIGSIFAVLLIIYFTNNFLSDNEKNLPQYLSQLTQGNLEAARNIVDGLKADRQSIFMSDFLRSFVLVGLALGIFWYYLKNKLSSKVALTAILILSAFDILQITPRYIKSDMFVDKVEISDQNFTPTEIDKQILTDTTNPRVLDLNRDVFNDALTCYFHRAVGGYSPAKLSIYEDLLNFQLRQKFNIKVLNMLNCKYVINKDNNGQPVLQTNNDALGYAWLTNKIIFKRTPLEVINELDSFNPQTDAVLFQKDQANIQHVNEYPAPTDYIKLIKNDHEIIYYQAQVAQPRFAVLSEIFYTQPGWKAYINGQETPIYQTNYVLRGIEIPSGKHDITFEFKPPVFYKYSNIASLTTLILIIGFLAAIVLEFLKWRKSMESSMQILPKTNPKSTEQPSKKNKK